MSERADAGMWLALQQDRLRAAMTRGDHDGSVRCLNELFDELEQQDDAVCEAACRWLAQEPALKELTMRMYLVLDAGAQGAAAYRSGRMRRAGAFYALTAACGEPNNYAYMLRRGEAVGGERSRAALMEMLREPVRQKQSVPMVNMALLAIEGGQEEEWDLAERIFRALPDGDVSSVVGWWKRLMYRDDPEGFLVMFMLHEAGKLPGLRAEDERLIRWYLMKELSAFPARYHRAWEASAEDVLAAEDSELSDCCVRAYLEHAPRSRETAAALLDTIAQYDDLRLYRALREDFSEFLTGEERRQVEADYRRLFDDDEDPFILED